jgi:hypothetical protein
MIRGSKHVYGYNFNNFNKATIKSGFNGALVGLKNLI